MARSLSSVNFFGASLWSSSTYKLCFIVIFLCQRIAYSQRVNKLSCERRPTHTTAHKLPGDNGFSIKIFGSDYTDYYEPGKDYTVVLNGSYTNQQFLDFMLIATWKEPNDETQTAGTFTHLLNHMTREDMYCHHVMTSITFHPSYKKSSAIFTWTAPRKGSGCVIFKATVVEHPDIWFSDDGGLTKMFCEKPETDTGAQTTAAPEAAAPQQVNSHSKRQSSQCCACDVAKYEMTFIGNWSRESHPKDFPAPERESLLHWSDIIGASHSSSYSIWSYDTFATAGVKSVCEYGWPRTLEGEIKQQSRNVRTVIKASGVWGYPAIYTTKRSARFSTDNTRPLMSLITMVGPSPDWCIGVDSVNMCLQNCTWLDNIDLELYPWDAGTDSGVTYLSSNLATFPRQKIQPITNRYPNNSASPFYGDERVKPMATVRVRRVGARAPSTPNQRCEANTDNQDNSGEEEEGEVSTENGKCMVTEWSEYTTCSVTCGVGTKTRTRQFKHPMGTRKMCPHMALQETDNCLGLVNECDGDPNEQVDICVITPWSNWSPCSVTCGSGSRIRTRDYLNPMGPLKCSHSLSDTEECIARIADCATVQIDWERVCMMEMNVGKCSGNFTRFYYDVNMKKCLPFAYTGCRGNQNQFDSLGECERNCATPMIDKEVDTGSQVQSGDVDCMVTEWTPFTECSVSCGTGMRSRSRMIKVRNSGNGEACPKKLRETVVCASVCDTEGSVTADVDCMLSEWSSWSDCSETCNDGVQVRQRMVKRAAQGQGQSCPEEEGMKEMRACNLGNCEDLTFPLCMLTEWAYTGDCSVACGVGKRAKKRMVKRGPCRDDTSLMEFESCVGTDCDEPRNCIISDWSSWDACDKPCGEMGTQTRFRMIVQPATYGGSCEFEEPKQMEKRTCFMGACMETTSASSAAGQPVDCIVEGWSPWSQCSKTCGTGKQVRRRKVRQKRRNKGQRCPPLKETRQCDTGYKCRRRRNKRL